MRHTTSAIHFITNKTYDFTHYIVACHATIPLLHCLCLHIQIFKFSKTGKSKYLAIVLDIWWPKFRVDCEGRDVFFEALV
jgi:hypothetical protein